MNTTTVREIKSVTGTVIPQNSTSSPVVLPAQVGGNRRISLLIRNTGTTNIEAFYDDTTATSGTGLRIDAGDAVSFGDSLAFPKCWSFRSLTSEAGSVAIAYCVVDAA